MLSRMKNEFKLVRILNIFRNLLRTTLLCYKLKYKIAVILVCKKLNLNSPQSYKIHCESEQ